MLKECEISAGKLDKDEGRSRVIARHRRHRRDRVRIDGSTGPDSCFPAHMKSRCFEAINSGSDDGDGGDPAR
jgi:hypothetical protein